MARETSLHSFEAYFKRAFTPLIVMCILYKEPKYVYEITQRINSLSNNRFDITALYPVIYKLQEDGRVKVAYEKVVNRRNRYYYELTEEGRNYLEEQIIIYGELITMVNQIFEKRMDG